MASAVLLAVVLLLASPVAMHAATAPAPAPAGGTTRKKSGCGAEKFPAGRSYANCTALKPLGATLYWTYDAAAASLSVAFVAKPAGAGGAGWVSWAINPTGDGMAGAQALVALKGSSGGAYEVRTYNVTGYAPLPAKSTPIAFKATGLAADESAGGKVRLYGKLQLNPGTEVVNHIWQVGSAVANGSPAKHAFAKENLDAKGKLALVGGAVMAPAPAPDASASSSAKAGGGSSPPSGGKSAAAAATYVSAPVLAVLALASFLAIV